MRQPLILNYYSLLPEHSETIPPALWAESLRKALNKYQLSVFARYNESTLERLLHAGVVDVRKAAVLALGLGGSIQQVNLALASRLHDEDDEVSEMAADALWSLWFRADTPENNRELQRLIRLDVTPETGDEILADFGALIKQAPRFAEAYNQRAVVHYRLEEFGRSVLDCEKTMRLNPVHFGAASGMAQSFFQQRKLRAALRCYRRANRINPRLDGVPELITTIEKSLGEEGKR